MKEGFVLLFGLLPYFNLVLAGLSCMNSSTNIVKLPQGVYSGHTSSGVTVFHGIPYTGLLQRFAPPTAVHHSDVHFNASIFGALCPQRPSRLEIATGPLPPDSGPQNESACGVLSVYRPVTEPDGRSLSVLIWLHGGAFLSGGSQTSWYSGARLARETGVLVVTIQYRLGVFGFLYNATSSAELGTQDAIFAIDWVKQHIESFGGNAGSITLMGQSAGAYLISLIGDVRPELFRRAILTSAPAGNTLSDIDASQIRRSVESALPLGRTLGTATTADLLDAQVAAIRKNANVSRAFAPVRRDGTAPGGRNTSCSIRKQYLIGWMHDDGAVFVEEELRRNNVSESLRTTFVPLITPSYTQKNVVVPNRQLTARLREQGHHITNFEHTWKPPGFPLNATHTVDLPLTWGDEIAWARAPMIGDEGFTEWERRGKLWRRAIGLFARHGKIPADIDGMKFDI